MRKINLKKYFTVFIITTMIFIIGILLSNTISNFKLNQLSEIEQDIKMDTMTMEIQYSLFSENPCFFSEEVPISEELFKLGLRLDYMESELGVGNPDVLRLKEYYSLLEINHWILTKKIKQECNKDTPIILYFYSRNKNDCPTCKEQGYALTSLREKYPNTKIYSFDIDLENKAIDTVKSMYVKNKEELPIIVINGINYNGFKDKKELENLLLSIKTYGHGI